MEISEATIQQERLQAIAEKRKRQAEMENKRRQLEDDRRLLQHLKSKALRERWLLDGAPSPTSQEGEAMKHQMLEDELKTKELEESIQRLEKELEILENGDSAASTKENLAEAAMKEQKREAMKTATYSVQKVQTTPLATAEGKKTSKSPVKMIEGSDMLRAAMYSVEITVEKDKVTGETKVLSSTTLLPQDLSMQGVKVYEDELKVVHEVRVDDHISHNDIHLLSSSEVEDLIHKADEVSDIEKEDDFGKGDKVDSRDDKPSSQKPTPRKEITGVQAKPTESPKIQNNLEGAEPSKEQPVTMIFMGYQNVEDENETKKVLGLEGTIKAELVVIEDADKAVSADSTNKEHAPPNGSAAVLPQKEDNRADGEKPEANDRDAKGGEQDLDMKKHRCKCCTVM